MSAPIRFGTDGVRGKAGEWPITPEGARRVGRAVAEVAQGPVVVGRDTRASSARLARAMTEGLLSGGADVASAGVLPTPALSAVVAARGAARGVMITASHNLWMDNGYKVLGPDGAKEPNEAGLERALQADLPEARRWGRLGRIRSGYKLWSSRLPQVNLHGLRVLLDCANGAAWRYAPAALARTGATVLLRGCEPDGRNINDGVGALHPPADLQGADLAICLDGDGDRVTLADEEGALDGDDLLLLLAAGTPGPVVGTVMSNGGLDEALGGRLRRVPVGDRHVAEEMRRIEARIGGEPSGHMLFWDGLPTSCGLSTALRVLRGGTGLRARLRWTRWPSARRDLRSRRPLETLREPALAEAAGNRVLVRYSGTEPVIRVLVEGPDAEGWADRIAAEILS